MKIVPFFAYYVWWHYTLAYRNLWGIYTNYFWFIYNFFSIPLLFRTMFYPWKKMGEDYKKGFDVKSFFSTFIINTFMRLVGVLIRFITIVAGLVALAFVNIFGIVAVVVWTIMPLIILTTFIFALVGIVPHI